MQYVAQVKHWANTGTFPVEKSLEHKGFDLDNVSLDLGVILAIGLAYRILAFAILMWQNRKG